MNPSPASQSRHDEGTKAEGFWAGCIRFVVNHPALVLGTFLLCGFSAVLWHISRQGDQLIELTSLQHARSISTTISEFRSLYTSEVVNAAGAHGMEITHDYKDNPNALPLPATLSMLLGERIGQHADGVATRLYSPYPFPWRRDKGGIKDAFARDAWRSLNDNPAVPFWRVDKVDGQAFMRYAIADRMQASCVQCHNTHPDTPKNDWQTGDVRGILEVDYPLDIAVAESKTFLRDTAALMAGLAIIGIVGTGFAIGGLRRSATQLGGLNRKLTTANTELAGQQNSLHRHNTELSLAKAQTEAAMATLEERAQELEDARLAALNMMQDMEVARCTSVAAAQAKTDFLANMSHEIRTPMTAILGYTDLLLESQDESAPPANVQAIKTIQRNGHHLLMVINDILDISKIEAGKMTVEHIPCSVSRVVAEVASLMRPRAIEKGLSLHVEYTSRIPKAIHSDPTRLRQVLINLIGNAIKFTKEGRIRIVTKLADQTETISPRMVFQVIDTGIGITQEQQNHLFQAFAQADTSMTRKFGGTGLGLMISKRLTQMLGGDITVSSQPGEGSTFTVTIDPGSLAGVEMVEFTDEATDANPVGSQATTATQKLPGKLDCRVLLAEDGPDNQRLIGFILKKAGADVTIAENGLVAYDKAIEAWKASQPFDVILMDMQMPELDGYGATRKLRNDGYKGSVVALTAHAMSSDRDKCLNAGCDDYATKPVDRAKLIALVHQWASKSATAAP